MFTNNKKYAKKIKKAEKCVVYENAVRELFGCEPVSYTHLDVYKRQVCHQGTGADHPERNAEFYKNVSGCKPAEAYSGGGDSHWLLHTSYV